MKKLEGLWQLFLQGLLAEQENFLFQHHYTFQREELMRVRNTILFERVKY